MANKDTMTLAEAAKQTGYSLNGVVKRLLEKRPNAIHVDASALDAIGNAARRGRGPSKDSARYKAFAAALSGLPESDIDRRYRDFLANRPKRKKSGTRSE